MNGQTEWPSLLADLEAKRDALTRVIDIVKTHFVPVNGTMPASENAARGKTKKAAKRNERTNERTKQGASQVTALRSLPDQPNPRAVVEARDAAILARLQHGPAATFTLREAMPKEAGKTTEMRKADCQNALTRLRVKGLIVNCEDGWKLA